MSDPIDPEILNNAIRVFDQSGLNGDGIVTAIKELADAGDKSNHEQIHLLLKFAQGFWYCLNQKHLSLIKKEGESNDNNYA